MVCVRVAFHENDGNHENDEDDSDSYKQGVERWIRGNHGIHDNDENHGNAGCKPRVPQTTGLEIPDFWHARDILAIFPRCPAQKLVFPGCRGTYRTFLPPTPSRG